MFVPYINNTASRCSFTKQANRRMYRLFFVVAFVLVARDASADSTSFGKCPKVDPQENFQMDKFLGSWYAIQKTSTKVPCISYNVTEKEGHPGYYLLTENFPSSKLANLVGLRHDHHITGELCAHDKSLPAVMDLKIPYSIGSSKFTVFMTDYDNYAAIFSCKTYPLTFSRLHKWSAQILSRTPSLNVEFIEKIRIRLAAYNVNPFSLSVINQNHCEEGKKGAGVKTATSLAEQVEETIRGIAKDVINLSPKVEEAIDTVKTVVKNATKCTCAGKKKSKVDENVGSVNTVEESTGGNKGFEQPDVFELFDHVDEDKIQKSDQPESSSPKPEGSNTVGNSLI